MEPTLGAGDVALLDHNSEGPIDGQVYAFLWGDNLRCRSVFTRPDGQINIRSDNPDKARFPDETVSANDPGFKVVARVCWRAGWL